MANDDFARGLFPRNLRPDGIHYYRHGTGVDLYLGTPGTLISGLMQPTGVNTAGAVRIMGAMVSFLTSPAGAPGEKTPYFKSSDATSTTHPLGYGWVGITDDPNQEYIVQENTNGTALANTNIGSVAPLIWRVSSGNTNTGWANLEFDRNAIVTTTAGQIQILRVMDAPNTDGTVNTTGNYCKWIGRIINHERSFYSTQP